MVLGCSQRDDDDAIKKAYKKAALQWHPDRWGHASEEEKKTAEHQFKECHEALTVLTDPKKRRMYDNGQLDDNVEVVQVRSFVVQ